ncbi:MAG: aerobic carbon-monoxide dehydrogenase large subunit [Solirubrobacteraceae bacterium]|jgi:carbon-monoxide dehydrogenase large subunit|nr:aerobic carbon-monoxide dehydrogenase large subunit [Solirubrobacteraceae bacterium]
MTAATDTSYVGRSVPRVEDLRLLTGQGCYADDFDRPGQLHAHVVRSDAGHARIVRIDAEAAARRPGVVRVLTAADLPDVRIPIRLFATENALLGLQPALATDRVRYVGDPVAVVVAVDPYVAEDAAEDVVVELEALPPLLDPVAAASDATQLLHPQMGSNVVDRVNTGKGEEAELAALFERAPVVVRERFHVQRHGAVPMETRGVLAEHDAETGELTVWGSAKVKHFNRRILATLLGVEEGSIRCIEGDVGGGFGARGEFYPEDYLIPWLAIELGRPVKWIEDRRENLIALNHSREQDWEIEMAAEADGTLLAFRAKAWFNQGAYIRTHGSVLLCELMLNHIPGPYRWAAYRAEAATVVTNKTPAGTYRGPGQYEPTFVRERMVDLVANEVGLDPVEMRRRNLVTTADMPYDTGLPDVDTGKPVYYDEGDFPLVFERLLERVDIEAIQRDVQERKARGDCVGLAVTAFTEMGNPGVFEQSRVVAEPDGRFTAYVGIASVGQGVQTVLSQIGADLLGVPMDRIEVSWHDTALVPEGQGAFSSRATVWGGYAIAGAIRDLHAKAIAAVAERFEVPPDVVSVDGATARFDDDAGERTVALGELGIEGFYRYEPEGGSHVLMGANVGVVEVDPGSGGVDLQRYAVAYEIGRAINPLTLEGQVRGGAVQGIGGALFEEFSYGADAQPLSTSFMDYAMPTAAEVPDIDVLLVELGETSPDDPIAGAKGGGEGGIIAAAATVANAVADAVGPRGRELTALPVMPEVVRRLASGDA